MESNYSKIRILNYGAQYTRNFLAPFFFIKLEISSSFLLLLVLIVILKLIPNNFYLVWKQDLIVSGVTIIVFSFLNKKIDYIIFLKYLNKLKKKADWFTLVGKKYLNKKLLSTSVDRETVRPVSTMQRKLYGKLVYELMFSHYKPYVT